MPSPFPGMDPYLEPYWGDVHSSLVLYARDQIQGHLPRDLRARVEERVFVDSPEEAEGDVYPDIRVIERGRGSGPAAPVSTTRTAEPIIVDLDEQITERFIEIIDVGSGRQVVTVIEVLSPANKCPGTSREKYLQKQKELLGGKVSLVEIDLLRAGRPVLALPTGRRPRERWRVVVRRGWKPTLAELYEIPLRQPLPTIKIPLRQTDADVPLDLQALLDQAYDNGAYQDDLDYEAEPDPPLDPDDAAWLDALLREKGLRSRPASTTRKRKKPRKS